MSIPNSKSSTTKNDNFSSSQEQQTKSPLNKEEETKNMATSRKISPTKLKIVTCSKSDSKQKRTVHKRHQQQKINRIREGLFSLRHGESSATDSSSKFSKLTEQEKNCIIERMKAKAAKIYKVNPRDPRQRLEGWLMNLYE